jgi:hypothetical protein
LVAAVLYNELMLRKCHPEGRIIITIIIIIIIIIIKGTNHTVNNLLVNNAN